MNADPNSNNGSRGLRYYAIALCATLAAGGLGFVVGAVSLFAGGHGGPAWPSIIFCAPISLYAGFVYSGKQYGHAMMVGTALLFALYTFLLLVVPRRAALIFIYLVHGTCALLIISRFH